MVNQGCPTPSMKLWSRLVCNISTSSCWTLLPTYENTTIQTKLLIDNTEWYLVHKRRLVTLTAWQRFQWLILMQSNLEEGKIKTSVSVGVGVRCRSVSGVVQCRCPVSVCTVNSTIHTYYEYSNNCKLFRILYILIAVLFYERTDYLYIERYGR